MTKIILLNKPFNTLCQFSDTQGRDTLASYIPKSMNDYYPAGRLDFDSEGLILLTNDGRLQHQIAHPTKNSEKTYCVQVEGQPSNESLLQFAAGLELKDGKTRPAKIKLVDEPASLWKRDPPIRQRKNQATSWLEVRLKEGKNRQVRRMTAAIGHPTLRLIRTSISHWKLAELLPGEYRTETINLPEQTPRKTPYKPKRGRPYR